MQKVKGPTHTVAQLDRGTVKRVVGLASLFSIGYGDLGSSIYYALGLTAFFALGATPIALAIAGIVFVCTALSYAEQSSVYPESGGSASFARHAFNDLISFIAGWGLMLDYIVTIAISAFAVAPYLGVLYAPLKVKAIQVGFTVGLLIILFFLNLFGIKHSSRVSLALAGFALITQLIIILFGYVTVTDLPLIWDHMRINVSGESWSPDWANFAKGTAMAMVAYTGIESIAQLGAEAKNPSKTLPRAIFLNIIILLFLYIGISIVGLSVMTPEELGTTFKDDPLTGIAKALPGIGHYMGVWVGILAAIILFVAANAGLIGSSRLAFNMGEYYQLPRFCFKLHPVYKTPYISLIIFTVLSIIIVIASRGELNFIADLYNFGAMIAFFFANLSLIVLRVKRPDLERPFKIGLNIPFLKHKIPITAVIGCIATFAVWILIIIDKPHGRYLGLAWMIVGVAMFLYYRRKFGLVQTGSLNIQKVKIPEFEALEIKHILVPIQQFVDAETMQMAAELASHHGAKITAVHVVVMPFQLPVDSKLSPQKIMQTEVILQRAEAICRDKGIVIDVKVVQGRNFDKVITLLTKEGDYDLLVVGWSSKVPGVSLDKIVRNAHCRVWLCYNRHDEKKFDDK